MSRPTVRRDMRDADHWLEEHHLHLQHLPGVGLVVRGTEIDVRKGLLALVLEAVPPDVLINPASGEPAFGAEAGDRTDGVARFTAGLDLATHRSILLDQLRDLDESDPMTTSPRSTWRSSPAASGAGGRSELQGGQLRSLLDHPVAESAARIATEVERRDGARPGRTDVARSPSRSSACPSSSGRRRPARDRRRPLHRPDHRGRRHPAPPVARRRRPAPAEPRRARPPAPGPIAVRPAGQQSPPAGGPRPLPRCLPGRRRDPRRGRPGRRARTCRSRRSACSRCTSPDRSSATACGPRSGSRSSARPGWRRPGSSCRASSPSSPRSR